MEQRFWLACYDIRDDKRLRRVAAVMERYGTRAQKSVFECWITPRQLAGPAEPRNGRDILRTAAPALFLVSPRQDRRNLHTLPDIEGADPLGAVDFMAR